MTLYPATLIKYAKKIFQKISLLLFLFGFTNTAISQEVERSYQFGSQTIKSWEKASLDSLFAEVIKKIAFDQINITLEKKGLEPKSNHGLLQKAADDQAEYMAMKEDDQLIRNENGKETTGDRISFYGGSRMGAELSGKTNIKKGDVPFTYAKIVDDIVFKWFATPKKAEILESIQYNLMAVGAATDTAKKRVYISVVMGNYKSFNEGLSLTYNITLPYTTKASGLLPYEASKCKKVLKRENINYLHQGLSVEDKVIYFESQDLKSFKKLIPKKKDGIMWIFYSASNSIVPVPM